MQRRWVGALALAVALASLVSAQDDAKNSARIRGVFVDGAGVPVAGVAVVHRWWPGDSATSTSGADGRFEGAIAWASHMETTWYELNARRFGYAQFRYRADERLGSGRDLDLGRIVLQPGGAAAGRALGEDGRPIGGAQCSILAAPASEAAIVESGDDAPDFGAVAANAASLDDGTFDVLGLAPGRYVAWVKHDASFWRSSAAFDVRAGERTQLGDFVLHPLPPERAILGVVFDPAGKPLAGVEVSTSIPSESKGGGDVRFSLAIDATTDAAGRFALYFPRPYTDPVELRATLRDGPFTDATLDDVAPGSRDVRLQLGAMREIELLVTDERGHAVEDFSWTIRVKTEKWLSSSGTAPAHHAGGRANVRIPVGNVAISIDSQRHHDTIQGVDVPADLRGEPMRFVLETLDGIRGRVVFEGRPVAGAQVELVQRSPNMLGKQLFPDYWDGLYYGLRGDLAQTDAQGEFEIPSDFPHLTYFAHAVAPGYAEGFSAATKVGGEAVTVELSRGGALEGDVVLPEARDPQGIEVRAFRKQARMGNIESELGCVFRARVDGAGHWRIDALAAGAWLVALDVPRGVASELGWDDERVKRCREVPWVFDVAADATTRASIDLRDEALLRLRGSLPTSLRGSSHHRAYAQLFLEPPLALQIGFTGIGDDGGFELVARTPGRYRLVIHAKPGGRSGSGVITDLVDVTSENGEWKRELPPEALQGQSVRLDPP